MSGPVRIDKYLWAIRAFKTRSEAAEACKGGRVKVGGDSAKPSRPIHEGEEIKVRKGVITYIYRVIRPTENRVGAALVPQFAENLTPEEEILKLKAPVETFQLQRDRGTGRPTKKDRRELDELWDTLLED
jgi:ribosome-associated heat shock protein Hsp15